MMARRHAWIAATAAAWSIGIGACGGDHSGADGFERIAFDSLFTRTSVVRLESSSTEPLVRVAGVAGRDSLLYVADASEANVKVYHATSGRLLQVIGRKGRGPGEFQLATWPQIDSRGRLHVYDPVQRLLQSFGPEGEHLGSRYLATPAETLDWVWLDSARYAAVVTLGTAAPPPALRPYVLHIMNGDSVEHSLIAVGDDPPPGEPASDLWGSIRAARIAEYGGQLYVTVSLVDTLWVVEPGSFDVSPLSLTFPGRAPPTLPDRAPATTREILQWIAEQELVVGPFPFEGGVAVPVSTDLANYTFGGVSAMVVFLGPSRQRLYVPEGPTLLGTTRDGALVALLGSETDARTIGFYRLRPTRRVDP